MFDRKSFVEKPRKHSENLKRMSYKFARLFQFSELTLPSDLQNFVSCERRLSDSDFSRNNNTKIRVILKINESKDTPSCLTFNKNQNCVGLIDPTPSRRSQTSNNNINLFPFDSIFTEFDQQNTLLASSVIEPIVDFFKGKDACLFSFGNAGLGKTKTMVGSDQSIANLGIIPCALVWVFQVMEQLKTSNKTRYAIRISALEIANKNIVRDLLINSTDSCQSQSSASSFEKTSSVLSNQKELPANNLQEAARILDNVLSARSSDNDSLTHFQFIIHLYQYQLDNSKLDEGVSKPVLGGRSRLHFLDLGSGRHGNDDSNILSLQGMSKVILALYTSQRHIPYKENVLTQLLKETLSVTAVTTMLVHISTKEQNYNETLQIVQLASKLYRTRSRKSRSVGFLITDETSSCSSSSSGFHSRRLRPHMGIGAARRSSGNSSASSELDLTSASELSCCETVIFRGATNVSESEKSLDQNSIKMNPLSESSESDLIISDKELSKDYFSSSNLLSPSVIRRRKISPRTNARVWPSSNSGLNVTPENAPELWVDGPNAVYKSDQKQPETSVPTTPKLSPKQPNNQHINVNASKPLMMSKETQCDDLWDSSSSLTDGSSHSNTLDRKDHRPLSDISECTEDTESNVATETDFVKNNLMDEMCPINDLDDLLESTFALSPLHQEIQAKLSGKQINYSTKPLNKSTLSHVIKEKDNNTQSAQENISEIQNINLKILSSNMEVEKTIPTVKNVEIRKHYHSASDSKKSSKNEQKERKSKSKCKNCSKKTPDQPSTSITSSNSTDFSRVESWIQKVEYEFQTSSNDINEDNVFLDDLTSYKCSQHSHHQSQPDISCHRDRSRSGRNKTQNLPVEYKWPPVQSWANNDINHVRYSLYGSCQVQPIPNDIVHMQMHSVQPNTSYGSHIPCVPHMSCHSTSLAAPPFHSPIMARHHVPQSNISYNRHSVLITQPPLPPLPQQTSSRDNKLSLRKNTHTPSSFEAQRINSSPSLLPHQPKCKTLPRDMYSDSSSPLRRIKSDLHPSNVPFKEQSMTALYDIKSKEKVKKDLSKNIISILFAPFISLRNKINKSKCTIDKQTASSENDIEKSLQRELEGNKVVNMDWPLNNQKPDREFIISSPYHLMTPPKKGILPTESSSHGSDSSSLLNRPVLKGQYSETSRQHKCRTKSSTNNQKNSTRQRPTSSGYGSIIIKGDSEVSSHNDSSSEYSISGQNHPKVLISHSKMKHSISLSNCKSNLDNHSCVNKFQAPEVSVDCCSSTISDNSKIKSISTAHDLILQEKLQISLNEERKIVIDYIETNRMRGIPVDAFIMNLICFKGVDNFEISDSTTRGECKSLIDKISFEIEQLNQKLIQAQHNLLLITSFDSNPCQ